MFINLFIGMHAKKQKCEGQKKTDFFFF